MLKSSYKQTENQENETKDWRDNRNYVVSRIGNWQVHVNHINKSGRDYVSKFQIASVKGKEAVNLKESKKVHEKALMKESKEEMM